VIWAGIIAGSLGCYALKLAGLSVPARVLENPTVARIAELLPIAMLSGLIAVQTFGADRHLTVDARVAGLAAAGVAVWRRLPFLVVVGLAAAVAAGVRALA
jgi:hypothetical protein